jgi:hypothetical protein
MLLNVLGLFLFETFATTDVIQPCSVYDHGPKTVDQERTLNCCSIMPSSFPTFRSSVSCPFFLRKLPIGMCILMLWDIVERGKVLSCSSIEI